MNFTSSRQLPWSFGFGSRLLQTLEVEKRRPTNGLMASTDRVLAAG